MTTLLELWKLLYTVVVLISFMWQTNLMTTCDCSVAAVFDCFLSLLQPEFNDALLEMFRIDYVGTAPYLSCNPAVLHHHLCANDRFLVLSSDGLYQYFSNDEVVSHVSWFMENVPEGDPAQYLVAELLCRAAKKNGQFCIHILSTAPI
jgi:hypothetical protein